jgi:hypothetical protein
MALCNCAERPRCKWRWCEDVAEWSVYRPRWREDPETYRFLCDTHKNLYIGAMTTKIKGIDRPANAPDDWRGSISECVRHAQIAIAFANRDQPRKARP